MTLRGALLLTPGLLFVYFTLRCLLAVVFQRPPEDSRPAVEVLPPRRD